MPRERRAETWTECHECAWSLGNPGDTGIRELLPVEHPCPSCGEPLVEVVGVAELFHAVGYREDADLIEQALEAVLYPLAPTVPEPEEAC